MATAGVISAELREWKRTTHVSPALCWRLVLPKGRYEPTEEEVEVLQRCRARESNLQSLGSLAGLGLGMLFLPMIVGSGLGNGKAQNDCLKLMLPLQTPLGHQARFLMRKHDPQSSLTRRYPVEEGIDSSEDATLEYVGGGAQRRRSAPAFGSHDNRASPLASPEPRDLSPSWERRGRASSSGSRSPREDREALMKQQDQDLDLDQGGPTTSSPLSSSTALRKAQFKRAQLRRQLAGSGEDEEDYADATEAAAEATSATIHPRASYVEEETEAPRREEHASAEALRRRKVKEALERRKAAQMSHTGQQEAWGGGREGRERSARNPYGDD